MRLSHGEGSLEKGKACWMSALSYYAGYEWSDHPECVCPIIRELGIKINDALPSDSAREALIGPHLYTPLGTKDDSLFDERGWRVVRFAVERVVDTLDRLGNPVTAHTLRDIDVTASGASGAVHAIAKGMRDYIQTAIEYAADTIYSVHHGYIVSHGAWHAARNALHAQGLSRNAANTVLAPDAMDLVLELCAMGEKTEVTQVRDVCEIAGWEK